MSGQPLSLFPNNKSNESLIFDIAKKLVEILAASGASISVIHDAFEAATSTQSETVQKTQLGTLGQLQRTSMEVMCRWRRDTRFLGTNGEPNKLHISNRSPSFFELCSTCDYAADPNKVLEKLLEFGAVRIDLDGRLVASTPTFLVGRRTSQETVVALEAVLHQLTGYVGVVHHNLCQSHERARPRFERSCTVVIAAELVPIFEQLVLRRGQEFVDTIDEWLERHRRLDSETGELAEVGVGAYFVDLGLLKSERTA